ncbi:MAG: hypothetical protein J3Q66DRAFT_58571 [Benniella sp.]|nr:MAG: hypothetical protein J3Q66DRAFT_58571 [Benniella sp.]
MLDLPELLEKVFQHLDRHDLTQCAQVNKQWHALTIPHIWQDLTCIRPGDTTGKAFGRIVHEDYLQENGFIMSFQQPSALSKYGHLIRLLPDPDDLERVLRPQASTGPCNGPTAHDLLFHLFKHSSKAKVKSLRYRSGDLGIDKMESILAFTLPRLRSLNFQVYPRGTQAVFIEFKHVLDQCSTTLENLSVAINMLRADEAVDMEDEAAEEEAICWTSLKDLALRHDHDTLDAGPLLAWMWKRCGQLERLYVRRIDKSTPSFVQAMLDYMHHLEEITIGDDTYSWAWNPKDKIGDDVVAALLSGSRHGWKSVSVMSTAKFGPGTMNALAMHYSTLEQLHIDGSKGLPSCDLVQILRSCPRLHTLWYVDMDNGRSVVDSMEFIDLDPDTGLLKPWLCEGSLKRLTVKISGIPRPDSENESVVAEAYPGQGREIQSQVYDRLGRLTQLEMLNLGNLCGSFYQYDCLEMSLESGLDKLSGLKSIEKMDLRKLETKIGIKEIQWMVENWPKLSAIYGLHDRRRDVEAVEWLQESCPKVALERFL